MREKVKKLNKMSKNSVIRLAVLIFVLILAAYCAVTLMSNYSDISRLRAQARDVDAQYEQQVNENEKVKAILENENKDEYIEQKAREKGYAKEGEIVFYDISSSK